MATISEQIRDKILSSEKGTIHFLSDFNYLGNDNQVRNYFVRMEHKKILVRLAQGIYLLPNIDPDIGILYPSGDTIAEAIAERDKAVILSTGALALNKLGLSTQVPMNSVFITTGTPRVILIGERKIIFKKAAPKNFSYKGQILPLIIFALRELGQKNVDSKILEKIREILIKHPEGTFMEDVVLAPAWIRKILLRIKNEL